MRQIVAAGFAAVGLFSAIAGAEPPPLPFHTIEGYGGGAITPMAYLVNGGSKDQPFGLPAAAFSYVNLGQKDLEALTLTETLYGRLEIGYGVDRLGLGKLPDDIKDATTVDIKRDDVYLHNLNLRFLAIEENRFGAYTPAVTTGVHFKYNEGIDSIDHRLGGALTNIGYDRDWGVDFTATATKTFANVFGRPLILTGGLRASQAAQIGALGFGNDYVFTFEGNVAYLPTDWLLLAYEFRQKSNPYDKIPGLVGDEDNWHAIDASLIIAPHATIVAGYGVFGNLANADANSAWWLQFKYEF
ncbi:MAG TPA: DUF3034 family protein [Tepidisphaeraceae bacterium]|nr:DUF3034 family protein [Tepidisphaeraceae bacterium]